MNSWSEFFVISLFFSSIVYVASKKNISSIIYVKARVINGEIVREFPYLAQIELEFENKEGKIEANVCGGSIISENFILTAAHCVDER